eukprot:TRINITY_DN74742_c0_g1_i1.p1 TRINITY_DN74742_c0_g1~~TRINITY_DN74742_c0_g1_i1.p1  ORF type:complete len:350 (+),score=54.13 TRINITY_DN74742_c0_g1_i1:36-1052(+)
MATAPQPPAAATGHGTVQSHERKGWRFEAHIRPLSRSDEIDELATREKLCKVPDMWCGGAALHIKHSASGFILELNGFDALRCCRFEPPPAESIQPSRAVLGCGEGPEAAEPGPLLGAVRCQFAEQWKPPSGNPDVREIRFNSDWTCFTPYWGTVRSASAAAAEEKRPSPSADAAKAGYASPAAPAEETAIPSRTVVDSETWEVVDEGLPMDLLRRQDEIHWYQEVLFWEDELADNGLCRLSVRVRVMPSFWFVLLMCEMRVDNVLLREVSTRFFCSFDSDHVLREWTWKQATYEALKSRGINLAENPSISHSSIGTSLMEERDVKQRFRHRLRFARS